MNRFRWIAALCFLLPAAASKLDERNVVTGQAAFSDAASLKPGTFRRIEATKLPPPFATESSNNPATIIDRPANAWPKAPAGFKVELYVDSGLQNPRQIRSAPNGDLFVADSSAGEVKIFRGLTAAGKPEQMATFATGLRWPFGINFYPPGPSPQWVYVSNDDAVLRFPYKNGDLKAGIAAKVVELPSGGHPTRDLVFSKDGKHMFVAVGSASDIDDPDTHPAEKYRADILQFSPEGKYEGIYASGLRNPVGLAANPETGELWASVNERDELGDNLVPDYISHVQPGGFYGWPFFYLGNHPDPRLNGKHSELRGKVIIPDVLLQPHNASLGLVFYDGKQFPAEYSGDLFAAQHGSSNRAKRAGYEVIRVPLEAGHASGIYEDFLTGFVTPDGEAWGRPVGVAVGRDGSLFVTDDGSKSIWRVSYQTAR